jgi:hypothetical protein
VKDLPPNQTRAARIHQSSEVKLVKAVRALERERHTQAHTQVKLVKAVRALERETHTQAHTQVKLVKAVRAQSSLIQSSPMSRHPADAAYQ